MMNAHTTAGALPWAGMPGVDVKATMHRAPNGDVSGRLVIDRPGHEQIVIEAKDNEDAIAKRLMTRYRNAMANAKSQGTVGLFGFLKKIKKLAKKIVRGKVVGKLVKGFKSVMKMPIIGPALGVAVPFMGASYLALKGAETLGISPWQANKMRREKNPRKRRAYARKIKARMRLVNRARWRRAMRRARGPRGWARRRPTRGYRPVRRPMYRRPYRGGYMAGDGAVAGAATAGAMRLLHRARRGEQRALQLIRCVDAKARKGQRHAITARKVLKACATQLRAKASGWGPSGSPSDDLNALIVASGGEIEDVMAAAGVHEPDELLAVAGVDLELEKAPGDDVDDDAQAAAIAGGGALDLTAGYYDILGAPAAYQTTAGYDPADPAAPNYDIAGDAHSHHLHIPAMDLRTSVDGMHLPMIVTGADGVPRRKTWNGLRWIWSELGPHRGIRSETQGFGLRDALLLGMKRIQSRELAS